MREWISIEQRLPDEQTTVLVAIEGYFLNIGYLQEDGWMLLDNKDWITGYDGPDDDVRVTHWMDLPVPPAYEDKKHEVELCYQAATGKEEGTQLRVSFPEHSKLPFPPTS